MQENSLIEMIRSTMFTKELLLYYFIKKRNDPYIIDALIKKLETFPETTIDELLPSLWYSSL